MLVAIMPDTTHADTSGSASEAAVCFRTCGVTCGNFFSPAFFSISLALSTVLRNARLTPFTDRVVRLSPSLFLAL